MTLSADQLSQISGKLTDQLSIERPAGDRRSPRAKVEGRLTLMPFVDGGCGFNVSLKDISTSGLRIHHNDRLPLDGEFVALIPQFGEALPVLCTIVYWEPVGPGEFAIGLQFERILSQAERTRTPQRTSLIGQVSSAIGRRFRKAS